MGRVAPVLVCLLGLCRLVGGEGLEPVEVLWGFDGLARTGTFTPVTVVLANRGRSDFRGSLALERAPAAGVSALGLPIKADVFVLAGGRLALPFQVLVQNPEECWRLSAGLFGRIELTGPRAGPPAMVALRAGRSDPLLRGLTSLDEARFPTSAGACDGLGLLALDHPPRWGGSPARAQALADWVAAGGTLVLAQDRGGVEPVLDGVLGSLSTDGPFCQGRVLRQDRPLEAIDPGTIARWKAECSPAREPAAPAVGADHALGQACAAQVRSAPPWRDIAILAIAYVLAASVGLWLYGRRAGSDWRVEAAAFLGLVGLACLGLHRLGASSHGRSDIMHGVSLALDLGGGRLLLDQRVHCFVRSGGRYAFDQGPDANGLWALPAADDTVDGTVSPAASGRCTVAMPALSHRLLRFAGMTAGRSPSVALVGTGDHPMVEVSDLDGAEVLRVWIAMDGTVRELDATTARRWLARGKAADVPSATQDQEAVDQADWTRKSFAHVGVAWARLLMHERVRRCPSWRVAGRVQVFLLLDDHGRCLPRLERDGREMTVTGRGFVLHQREFDRLLGGAPPSDLGGPGVPTGALDAEAPQPKTQGPKPQDPTR